MSRVPGRGLSHKHVPPHLLLRTVPETNGLTGGPRPYLGCRWVRMGPGRRVVLNPLLGNGVSCHSPEDRTGPGGEEPEDWVGPVCPRYDLEVRTELETVITRE